MSDKEKKEALHISDPAFEQFLQKEKLRLKGNDGPLHKLKQMLLYNIVLGTVLSFFYILSMFYVSIWQVKFALVLIIGFCIWSLYDAVKLYRGLNFEIITTNSVLTELRRHYDGISRWMNLNQQVALFIYPFSAAAGFLLGGTIGSGKQVEYFIYKPGIIATLIICVVVLEPICYYGAKWMFKVTFGTQMDALKKNIEELERG